MPQLNDDKGNIWDLEANIQGQLTATKVTTAKGLPLLMQETNIPATVTYELRITGQGFLSLFLAPAGSRGSTRLQLSSPDPGTFFLLQVFDGQLQVLNKSLGPVIVLGQLILPNEGYPRPVQPGGIGTPVTMPAQTDGERIGLWVAGCGHWFNHWDLRSAEIGGIATALVCCPMCLYVQRLITPYSAIHSDQNMIIFA